MQSGRRFIPIDEWSDPRHRRGLSGEVAAMGFLISCGWQIEAHRYRVGRHDLDLVARRGTVIAFVEVKTRRSMVCGSGLEAVSRLKQRSIAKVAERWRLRFGRESDLYRFDLLSVTELDSGRLVLEHVPDAWRLGRRW